jgi:hypothetical protein
MAADAKLFAVVVCQLAARIPFEGVMKFAAAKLKICANQVNHFYMESPIF